VDPEFGEGVSAGVGCFWGMAGVGWVGWWVEGWGGGEGGA
jgi:hypothetical protein